MKKAFLSIFSVMALAMGFTACQKEAKVENMRFTASMEACTDMESKTVLDGVHVNWEANDQIIVYGTEGCGVFTAITHGTNQTTIDFGDGTANPGNAPYTAFYPVSLATSANQVMIPAVVNSVDGRLTEFPMYAESDNEILTFKNLCGALKLNLQKENVSIESIQISATGANLNGEYRVRNSGIIPTMFYLGNGTNTVTLNLTEAQDITTAKDFYITLPHGNYRGVVITINTNDGRQCVKTLKADKSINIGRSQVTTIVLGSANLNF